MPGFASERERHFGEYDRCQAEAECDGADAASAEVLLDFAGESDGGAVVGGVDLDGAGFWRLRGCRGRQERDQSGSHDSSRARFPVKAETTRARRLRHRPPPGGCEVEVAAVFVLNSGVTSRFPRC